MKSKTPAARLLRPLGPYPPSTVDPKSVATDFYGNIYVSSFGSSPNGSKGRIHIFDPQGHFISELKVQAEGSSAPNGPTSLAIDSEGTLYVVAEVKTDANSPLHA